MGSNFHPLHPFINSTGNIQVDTLCTHTSCLYNQSISTAIFTGIASRMKCPSNPSRRRFHHHISSSSSSTRSATTTLVLLLICVTSLFPSPASCQLLGSLMSMTGLGNLNPFSGLSSGLSGGGGLLSSLRGGGSSSLFGSLTGSSSSSPSLGAGSMMSSFAPDLGTNIYSLNMSSSTQIFRTLFSLTHFISFQNIPETISCDSFS